MTRLVVVDLDGTLCDSSHRDQYAQNGEWDEYHSRCHLDEPHGDVLLLLRTLVDAHNGGGEPFTVVGCTGRNERWRHATEQWLVLHDVPVDFVLMRPDFDYRSDADVKLELLREWYSSTEGAAEMPLHERVAFVLEDRDKMVEAWRGAGFNCWQVRQGTF